MLGSSPPASKWYVPEHEQAAKHPHSLRNIETEEVAMKQLQVSRPQGRWYSTRVDGHQAQVLVQFSRLSCPAVSLSWHCKWVHQFKISSSWLDHSVH
jgi:hypothetical protein